MPACHQGHRPTLPWFGSKLSKNSMPERVRASYSQPGIAPHSARALAASPATSPSGSPALRSRVRVWLTATSGPHRHSVPLSPRTGPVFSRRSSPLRTPAVEESAFEGTLSCRSLALGQGDSRVWDAGKGKALGVRISVERSRSLVHDPSSSLLAARGGGHMTRRGFTQTHLSRPPVMRGLRVHAGHPCSRP